jgi:hypothetical protein
MLALFWAIAALGCNSPTASEAPELDPTSSVLTLTGAQVVVEGQVVNGQTMHAGQTHGNATLFQATLTGPNGGPAPGHTVQVQYHTPGGGSGGMMNGAGLMTLYDDGTHGDPVAGDGTYCYADEDGHYGFHMPWAPPGQYHYEFFGFDHDDHHSNHMNVVVTITS